MHLLLEKAKNGELTAKYDNLFLHSSYNPSKEAERFVESVKINYDPPYIIMAEPGLGYALPLLRQKFHKSKIILIRYTQELSKYNKDADFIINYFDNNESLSSKILNIINEEDLISSLFLEWPASSKIFHEKEKKLLVEIKNCFENAKTLLITREFFEKKWLVNSISFFTFANNIVKINSKIKKPIIIISSGPSLKDSISIIKQNRNKVFIIALSSAIKVCISNNINPDLAFTTDGGFWAGQHLKQLYKHNITVAAPIEGYLQRKLLNDLQILPLDYGDGLSHELIKKMNIPTMEGERNGTVSGTALKFALHNSTENIYFCGLDMSNQKGFQHCQPNENEINNSLKDNKLNNTEIRSIKSEFSNSVLNIYKNWFEQLKLNGRKVFRVINTEFKKNNLGQIKDISTNSFNNELNNIENDNKNSITYFEKINWNKDLYKLNNYIESIYKSDIWMNNLFPLSMNTLKRDKTNTDIKDRLNKENNTIVKKIRKLLNEK